MMQTWNELTAFWMSSRQRSVCLALALAAAVFILVNEDKQMSVLKQMAAGFLGICLIFYNPLIAFIYEKVSGKYYPFAKLGLGLPFLPFLAAAGAVLLVKIGRNKRDKLVLAAGFVLTAFLSGNLVLFASVDSAGNSAVDPYDSELSSAQGESMQQMIRNAAQELRELGAAPLLVAPKEIMEEIRRLDGSIVLAYGRDMWQTQALSYLHETYDEEQILLCQMMESKDAEAADVAEYAITAGCNLFVAREELDSTFAQAHHLWLFGEEQGLYLYMLH